MLNAAQKPYFQEKNVLSGTGTLNHKAFEEL